MALRERRPVPILAASLAALLAFPTVTLPAASADDGRERAGRVKLRVATAVLEQSVAAEGGTLVARYESDSLWELAAVRARLLARLHPEVELLPDENRILLNTGALDTTGDEAQALRGAVGSFEGRRLHLVQFVGPIQPAWYDALAATGVEVVQPIPSNAYLVWGDAGALGELQALARSSAAVQWDGDYAPEYKLQPGARARGGAKRAPQPANDAFQVQLVADPAANADTFQLVDSLRTGAVRQRYEGLVYVNFVVELPVTSLQALAERPDVVSIARWSEPRKLDERQDVVAAGAVSGSPAVPTPMDYLAYLAGKGFDTAAPTSFAVNLSDSGVDDGTITPNHFALYRVGNPSVPSDSRVVYNRLLGTPNAGSTLQGCDGHGNESAHILGGYVPSGTVGGVDFGTFPHADAAHFRRGLGLAPFVKLGASVIFDPDTFTSPIYQDLESQAYRDGARISNNSWGGGGNYTVDAQQYDALVRDAQPDTGCAPPSCVSAPGNQEYLIVFAAGNDGIFPNSINTPGTAKNVITVGAAEGVNPFGAPDGCGVGDAGADNANDMVAFSSRGPTADGRSKPDIVAPGTHVTGGVAQASIASPAGSGTGARLACFDANGVCGGPGGSDFYPSGQQWYTASSGTSQATPAVAGVAALIRQHFLNQGLPAPSPALTKALLMNSARYLTGAGANDTLPSNRQGMGEVSLNGYFDVFATAHSLHDEVPAEVFTASGQQRVFTGVVSDSARPLRVTLAWTDAPGPTSGDAFVNNLDLEVTAGGATYKGNVFSGASSVTGGAADTRNNVESVFLPAGVAGNLVVKVKATNIAGDGIPNNGVPLDQDFALVAYDVTEAPLPVIAAGATAITAESCGPANNAIDPAETVTVNFGLQNIGTGSTTSLVASLQATGGVTAPSGPQNYGALAANGGSVARPFTFTAGTGCGQPITATFQLQDGALNLGTVTFAFLTGALGAPSTSTFSTGNIAVPIPDPGSVEIPMSVVATGLVDDVNVKVRLNHTFDGDLELSLVSPTGTVVPLVSDRGGDGDNFGTGFNDCSGTPTVLDDAAATAVGAGTAPFPGSFRPESPLAAVAGAPAAGTWKLRAVDTNAADTGTIGCLQLELTRRPVLCCGVGTPQVVPAGPATLVAESFLPPNNAPDPGEVVTFAFSLANTGDGSTTNLIATLQSSASITPLTVSQAYGVMLPGGPAVQKQFAFIPHGVCGAPFQTTFHLQDGALDLGNVVFSFQFGATNMHTTTFSNPTAITIPASGTGAPTGSPAVPYPSSVLVSGILDPVSKIAVRLKSYSHTFPDDVDALLVSPLGRKLIVMSDAGDANEAVNLDVTLDDAAAAALPDSTPFGSGSYRPSNFDTVQDPFPAPAPAGPHLSPAPGGAETLTSAFVTGNQDPNGTWSLYVVDDAGADVGSVAGGWELAVTTSAPLCSTPVELQGFAIE